MGAAVSPRNNCSSWPRILVLGLRSPEVGAQVRGILLNAGGFAVSLEDGENGLVDLIIPILTLRLDPRTVLTELRISMPGARLLPILHKKHLSDGFDRLPPGVTDFLVSPVRGRELLARVRRLLPGGVTEEIEGVRERLHESMALDRLRGADPAFQAVKQQILRIAKTDVMVLVTGETGTGKELTAQAIHYLSGRASKPFVPVECGALPPELFENELFGHHRGAFTDARSDQPGLIAEAEGGTLFLDEIDALAPGAQVKLLRFLEHRTFRPLGSPRSLQANVRVVAATNTDLSAKLREGKFRQDLFYRLHVVTLLLPPLRERIGDIGLLADYFLDRHAPADDRWRFAPDAVQALSKYRWPGNVRELENVVCQLVHMSSPRLIRAADLPWPTRPLQPIDGDSTESFRTTKARAIAEFEHKYLATLLQAYRGNISRAAHAARQDRRTFRRLIQKHRLDPSIWAGTR